ncbi:hypothetical protein ABBQ32_007799 [Trebouxia sp. C0010 RCD-2024]
MNVSEHELNGLYTWVDEIPLSRPKRNIARDFSDGVLVAEIVQHFHPKLVELHNYSGAHGATQKQYNWTTLNQRVFKKLDFVLAKSEIEAVVNCDPGAVERVLKLVKVKLEKYNDRQSQRSSSNEGDSPGYQELSSRTPGSTGGQMGDSTGRRTQSRTAKPSPTAQAHVTVKGASDKASAAELADKEQTILELRETNEIIETKVKKLEQLVRLKDAKIQTLIQKMQAAGLA